MKTWIDEKNKLEWQVENPLDPMNWHDAINYAKSLGDGWRVPRIEELETLLDRTKFDPAMRKGIPFNNSGNYWSSTSYLGAISIHNGRTIDAWYVSFKYGHVDNYNKTYPHYVRCVRDIK